MSINLLPNEAKFLANRIKFGKQVLTVTYVMGGVWFSGLVIIYLIWFIFRQVYLAAGNKLTQAQTAYSQLSEHLITNQKLRYRVKLVSKILDSRFEYAHAFRTITNLFPATVTIKQFELQPDGSFVVNASVDQHSLMDEVEKRVLEINQGKSPDFSLAVLKSLSVNGRSWNFTLQVTIR